MLFFSLLVSSTVQVFQKGLVAMFKERDEDIIFLETCYLHKRRHMIIECIPVPKEVGDMAPIYFKVCVRVPVWVCIIIFMYVCMCVYVYVYVCACVYVRVYMCVCVCVCVHLYVRVLLICSALLFT